ncbi:MAG: nucleoside hydrolase [Desulfohalobiaceae bacterium]|nr:nucleoside hydrolase [Desulfohalobiaceae bacterium]
MPKPVIIDTDPGIDDALALLLAFGSPELAPVCITSVSGNVDVDTATDNILRILAHIGPDPAPTVARGAETPLEKAPEHATFLHGIDGLGDAGGELPDPRGDDAPGLSEEHAVDSILRHIEQSPEPPVLVALGPMTNIALAAQKAPQTLRHLDRLIIMGGAVTVAGNITPAAEFNFYVDPLAAQIVLDSGLPITLTGLDVTRKARLELRDLDACPDTPRTRLVQRITSSLFTHSQETEGTESIPLHDPLAIALSFRPDLCSTRELPVQVETRGEICEGMSLADRRPVLPRLKDPPNAHVCLDLAADSFLTLFRERVLWEQSLSSEAQTRT